MSEASTPDREVQPRAPAPVCRALDPAKFRRRETTAEGTPRASVEIDRLETVWFNTGTLCNIECPNCYIESSPTNDRLEYLTRAEVFSYLDEIARRKLPVREIGFTGGEPFVNPELPDMLEEALGRSFEVLVLTNGMRPMMRPAVRSRLLTMNRRYGAKLHLRISVDHHTRELHERERGAGSWNAVFAGLRWSIDNGIRLTIAGRSRWGESDEIARAGYADLFQRAAIPIECDNPEQLVLFPELDISLDVPEITVDCWRALGVSPAEIMCARSRMVIKRRGAERPVVVTCTLLPYDRRFELGETLEESLVPIYLNHPHCARFCVLGGGSCTAR
ncbi:MAG: radical SAM protein [Acidobacteriota bacterium]|nr:radical SAM protein [Acidobacteriota bacterium]